MRNSPSATRRMIVTRSSGPDVLEDECGGAGLDGVEQRVLVLVDGEDDDPGRGQLALDALGRLDPARRRQRQVHEDDVGRRLERTVDRAPRVLGLADDVEVRLAREDVGDPDPEQGMVVDDEDPGHLARRRDDRDHPDAAPVRRIPSQSSVLLCSREGARRDRESDHGTAVRSRSYVEAGADLLGSLLHDLHAEIPAAARGHRARVESATVVADLQGPSIAGHVGADQPTVEAACLRTFCRASCATRRTTVRCRSSSRSARGPQVGRDGQPRRRPEPIDRIRRCATSRPAASTVGGRSSEMNSRTVGELASQQRAQLAQPVHALAAGSRSTSRSMSSTSKIALVRAWAGPSWISRPILARSASSASRYQRGGLHRSRSIGVGHGASPGQPIS